MGDDTHQEPDGDQRGDDAVMVKLATQRMQDDRHARGAAAPVAGVRRSRWSSPTGSTLILALAFTTIIMSLTVAVLAFAKAGNKSVHAYQIERNRRYAIDGALQTATQFVANDSTLGVTGGSGNCNMRYLIREGVAVRGEGAITDGSYLVVECAPTSTSLTGGLASGTGNPQDARDVTFNVYCNNEPTAPAPMGGRLTCGSGTSTRKLATARIRFEPDFTKTSPADAPKRAVIPKIISWEVRS